MSAPDRATVTVRADGVPIATLLSELALVYPLEKLEIQSAVQQRAVWIVLENMPPEVALVRILQASGLHFGVSGRRVIIGEWTGPAKAEALALRTSAEEPPSEVVARAQADAIAAAAELQAISDAAGDESTILPTMPVAFVANGENITYLEPNFVPYKMRPEVRALRMAIDVAKIP